MSDLDVKEENFVSGRGEGSQVNIGPNVFPLRCPVTVKDIVHAFFVSSVPYDSVFNSKYPISF